MDSDQIQCYAASDLSLVFAQGFLFQYLGVSMVCVFSIGVTPVSLIKTDDSKSSSALIELCTFLLKSFNLTDFLRSKVLIHVLPFTTLWANSADDKLMIFSYF